MLASEINPAGHPAGFIHEKAQKARAEILCYKQKRTMLT
jgi:hypothetical protein